MSPSAADFVSHLLEVDRRNSFDAASHRARVFVLPGDDASAVFELKPENVVARLRRLESEVGSLWPEAPLDVRTYRLLSLHLIESVREGGDELFRVTPAGIVSLGRPSTTTSSDSNSQR